MKTAKVIEFFGGITQTAKAFDVSVQAVYQWKADGKMPKARAIEAQVLSFNHLTYEATAYT